MRDGRSEGEFAAVALHEPTKTKYIPSAFESAIKLILSLSCIVFGYHERR